MVIAFHLSWTTYGHWFPNDPRGSWSDEVWQPQLAALRELDEERKVARPRTVHNAVLQTFLNQARADLNWDTVQLVPPEITVVGQVFAEVGTVWDLSIRACAIMPNHVHLIIERHNFPYERIVNRLKGRSAQRIREHRGLQVAENYKERVPIWTKGYWSRYIDHDRQLQTAIGYVRENPIREGLGLQHWEFIR